MPRPKKQQSLNGIFEQFTAQLGSLVKEKVNQAVAEATEAFYCGASKVSEKHAPAEAADEPAAPKRRRRRRRKAAKKAVHSAPVSAPSPEIKPAD